jgi:hypothetical protein
MTTKNSLIEKIYKKFPAQIDLINELYEESESFRTLCDDYIDCQSVVERLKYNVRMVERNILQDYEQLSGELVDEIISRIKSESGVT